MVTNDWCIYTNKDKIEKLLTEALNHNANETTFICVRLKRELEEEKAISKLNAEKAASPTVKTMIIKPSPKKRKQKQPTNRNGNANDYKKVN